MAKSIVAVFRSQGDAEDAIHELSGLGYDAKSISIVMRQIHDSERMAEKTGASVGGGAAAGATTGAVLGGLAGLLVGVGAIVIPGFGAVLVGGPIAAALGLTGAAATTASGAVTGALAGGLLGAIMGLGVPEPQARQYEEIIRGGGVLLAVPIMDRRAEEVTEVMQDFNAYDIRELDIPNQRDDYRSSTQGDDTDLSFG